MPMAPIFIFSGMCYNYSNYIPYEGGLILKYKLRLGERQALLKEFSEKYSFNYTNGFTHSELPIITMELPNEVQFYSWGLIPQWVKTRQQAQDIRKLTLNATCEGVFEKPSFKYSIKTKRCLVPATGFFEWHSRLGAKYPYHVTVVDYDFPDDSRSFYFGGLYSNWVDKETGEVLNTFTIITTPANEKMEFIHNSKKRMPFILHEKDENKWLDPNTSEAELKALMVPYPDKYIKGFTITKLITGKADRNVPEVLEQDFYEGIPDVV
jgi:putative SOS response-associated peptidase YedK